MEPSLGWIFTCGAIAICAMILPGLSGSFLLLLLGQYDFILFQLHRLLQGDVNSAGPHVGIFLIGITVGILSFSRLLHALLARAHDGTMAALAGLMIGSLYKLWPWPPPSLTGDSPLAPIDGLVLGPAVACLIGMTLVGVFLHMDRDRVESSTAPPRSACPPLRPGNGSQKTQTRGENVPGGSQETHPGLLSRPLESPLRGAASS